MGDCLCGARASNSRRQRHKCDQTLAYQENNAQHIFLDTAPCCWQDTHNTINLQGGPQVNIDARELRRLALAVQGVLVAAPRGRQVIQQRPDRLRPGGGRGPARQHLY